MSFSLGFLAFPVVAAGVLGTYMGLARVIQRDGNLAKLAGSQRSSTLGFSTRLIGEIGEADEESLDGVIPETERAAKAS